MDEARYRAAERDLWASLGCAPTELRVHLRRNDVEVRISQLGEGPPVLFLHGGPGTSGPVFADLAARLPNFRCLLLDRPGTGLSDHRHLAGPTAVRSEAETLVVDVLDALGIPRAHLVGSSHGSYIALHTAAAHPDRVGRTVHLGCPGFAEGMTVTAFDRLVLAPGARHVLGWFPASRRSVLTTMRQLGHDRVVEADGFSSAWLDWSVAVLRDTDTMRNELRSMAAMGTFRRGFDEALTIDRELLARVRSPSSLVWGGSDPYGDEAVARRLVDGLPSADVEMLPAAGHLPWLDDLDRVASAVHRHLSATAPGIREDPTPVAPPPPGR